MIGDGCFPAGSMVATDHGPQPVEALAPGAIIETATGPQPLAGIEQLTPGPGAAILLQPGALGPGRPARALLVSPEQLLLVPDPALPEPVLVPAGALVNGHLVQRTTRPADLAWFALGFATHTLPLVEALACGCRRDGATPLSARLLPPGPGLFALRSRLSRATPTPPPPEPPAPPAQAAPPPPPAADAPALRLIADAAPIEAEPPAGEGGAWRFTIPAGATRLSLVSPVGHPADSDSDGRAYGVAVTALLLDGIPLALAGPAAGPGFYDPEGEAPHAWRWTNGAAELALPPCATPRRLEVTLTDWHTRLRRGG